MTTKPLTHDEAINALCGCAATVTVLSYQEAIEGYFKLRGLPIPPDALSTPKPASDAGAVEVSVEHLTKRLSKPGAFRMDDERHVRTLLSTAAADKAEIERLKTGWSECFTTACDWMERAISAAPILKRKGHKMTDLPTHPASGEALTGDLRSAVHAWIRDDVPVAGKMMLLPGHVDALVARLSATPSPDKLKIAVEKLEKARSITKDRSRDDWSVIVETGKSIDAALSALKGEGA